MILPLGVKDGSVSSVIEDRRIREVYTKRGMLDLGGFASLREKMTEKEIGKVVVDAGLIPNRK